jgi:hypothetical protein
MQKPRVAPEKRPSVISATLSPMPCPYSAAVVDSISRMPGPPLGPFVADDEHVAFLVGASRRLEALFLAVEHARRAGERSFCMPATFTMAPSGARLPAADHAAGRRSASPGG